MIFIALGTQKFQFNRLLQMIDQLISNGKIVESVFAQIGNSDYVPKNIQYTSFMSKFDFEKKIRECDVLITHSGVATIITGLKYEKKVIVVPRLAKYEEHIDNHQVQIAEAFSEQNYVITYTENDSLEELIEKAKHCEFAKYTSQRKQMVETIESFILKI